jgi:HTH-type transcriptional regulator, glycine betaine synthesis regulator
MLGNAENQVILQVADTVGALMESWGFKRNMGRIWTLLYLEPKPLSAPDIGDRLSLSAGAVSMLLAELLQWGAVRKAWLVGERREHYEAESDIWKLVSRVFRERELRWIEEAAAGFAAANTALTGSSSSVQAPPDGLETERRKRIEDRVAGLMNLAQIGSHLLNSILQGESVDALPLKSVGQISELAKRGDAPPLKDK